MRSLIVASVLSACQLTTTAWAGPGTERQQQLASLLEQDCGSCHGLTRKGGLGPALLPANLHGKSDDYLVQTILDGHPGTAMPPWSFMLSRADAHWLVDQLKRPEVVK